MSFSVQLDANDPTPPYAQLSRQISDAISSGLLSVGTQLPTVRQLAGDLGVANGTVMRAYATLESAGLVQTGRRNGTVVADAPVLTQESQGARLGELALALIAQARRLGATDAQIVDAVHRQLASDAA